VPSIDAARAPVHSTGALCYVHMVVGEVVCRLGPHTSGGIGGHPPNAGDTRHPCGKTIPKDGTKTFTSAAEVTVTQRCMVNIVE
jgi:hypothetical protein